MLVKTFYMQSTPDKWQQPALEVQVDYNPEDRSISDYKLTILGDGKRIDVTLLFTNNWPVLVQDILQETDWENLKDEN